MPANGNAERYFLAVWPDETLRTRLGSWSESIQADTGARRIPASKLHITLVFLGPMAAPELDAVRALAAEAPWRGAVLTLDRIGYWRRSRIIWAGSSDGSTDLAALAEGLRDGLRRLGFRIEERPFVPHVTLYRKARRKPRWQRRIIDWRIDEFCLVRSRLSSEGSQYEVLDRWCARGDVE